MPRGLVLMLLSIIFPPVTMAKPLRISDNKFFTISVDCNGQKECAYNNQEEIPVVVRLDNISSNGFYIPWVYIKKTGPSVKLMDQYSRKNIILKQRLVSWDLKEKMLYIPAGSYVSFSWDLLHRDIAPFVKNGTIHVNAIFKIRTKIYDAKNSDGGEFISTSKLLITNNNLTLNKH
ncbi:hypothetical protein [Pseudescherichia sp.]|uniref:hypothetical protein n=1 Tax=Pseudescherichia sp. TaxID=2055881 RepID=UPI00289D25F2|nr:hypothetical protein [Pseudescherichia sp.]